MNIALQLYSIRDALAADYQGTLEQVKNIGYTGVELFGDHLPAAEIKNLLKTLQLEPVAHHFAFDPLKADFAACLERTAATGSKIIVCAWSAASPERPWESILTDLAQMNAQATAFGLTFVYHNHDHEISQYVGGKRVLDAILECCDLEIDVAWVQAGGLNPTDYVQQHAQKAKLLHIKDVKLEAGNWQTVELGQGSVPLAAILEQAPKTASSWLIVEQDHSPDPIGSAARNFAWLQAQ